MKYLYAFAFTFFILALSPIVSAQAPARAGQKVDPSSIFLSGYTALSEAEKLEKEMKYKDAWNKYHQAKRYYKSIEINYPDWKQALIERKLKITNDKIKEIQPLAEKEHIASQQKLADYNTAKTSENGIANPNLPQITSAVDQRRANEISAIQKEFQKKFQEEQNKHKIQVAKLNKELATLQDQLRRSAQGLNTENTQTKILNDQINKLTNDLNLSKQQFSNSQKKQLETINKLTRERMLLATAPLRQDIERLTQDKARSEEEMKIMVARHLKTLTSITKLQDEREKLNNELALVQAALVEKNKKLEKVQNAGNKVVTALRDQIKAQQLEITTLNEKLVASEKRNAELVGQLTLANDINKELGQHLASVTLERDKLSELIDLSDTDRTKKTIQEALRLGQELRTANESIKMLQKNQNASQDQIILAENKLAVAKKKIIDLQALNTNYIRRIGSLENSLNATKEQLDARLADAPDNPLQKEEVDILKKALKRITTQLERRKQAESLLITEYQKSDGKNPGLTNAIINLTDTTVRLTEKESKLLKEKAVTDSFSLNSGNITAEQRKIAQAKSKNQIESLESLARRCVEKGKLQTAKEIYDEAYDQHGYHYPFFINRGVVRAQLREFIEAEKIFESGSQLKENSPYTHFMLGFCRYKNSKDELAKKSLETVIHLRPDHVNAYNYLGVISYSESNYPKAIEYLSKAVSINPDNIEAQFNLSNAHLMSGAKEQAVAAYNQALRAGLTPNFEYEQQLGLNKNTNAN